MGIGNAVMTTAIPSLIRPPPWIPMIDHLPQTWGQCGDIHGSRLPSVRLWRARSYRPVTCCYKWNSLQAASIGAHCCKCYEIYSLDNFVLKTNWDNWRSMSSRVFAALTPLKTCRWVHQRPVFCSHNLWLRLSIKVAWIDIFKCDLYQKFLLQPVLRI